jgi:6-phosphofructokinase 1
MIRAIPSNASDNVYCTLLAHGVIHGAMAGYCGFTVGPVNVRHCYIPIPRAVEYSRHVNVADRMWARLMSSTNQPNFVEYGNAIQQKREKNEKVENEEPVDVIETGNRQGWPKDQTESVSVTVSEPVSEPDDPTV